MKVRKVQTSLIGAILLLTMAATSPLHPSSITVSGTISTNTTWSGVDSAKVVGDITINNGITLTINPGMIVCFMGHYKIDVQGRLLAEGDESNHIKFTPTNQSTGWNRIEFNDPSDANDTTKISYCTFEYGKSNTSNYEEDYGGAINVYYYSKVLISNSLFQNNYAEYNGGAISLNSSGIQVKNCIFKDNSAGYLAGAIFIRSCSPTLINCLFYNNLAGTAADIWAVTNSNPLITNCTFAGNSDYEVAVHLKYNSNPIIRNSIFYVNNFIQFYLETDDCDPDFYYCDVKGGTGGIFSNEGSFTGDYDQCINSNPLFTGTGEHLYDLQNTSPCINAGDPATTVGDIGTEDLGGDYRVQNGRIDIGAYESFSTSATLSTPGNCLDFDGTDDYVNVGTFSNFPLGNTMTIECWIKPNTLSDRQGIFSTRFNNAAGAFQLEVGIGAGGTNRIAVSGVSAWVAQTGDDAIRTGEWTHIAYTRSGTGSGTHTLYVNGQAQTLISDANYTFVDNTSNKVVGSGTNNSQFFNGKIDELRVWTVVRTAAQIREKMYLPITGTENGLVGYWQFAESTGTQAADAIYDNKGTLTNMDNSDWVASTIPFYTGSFSSQTEANGVVDFTGTGLSMNFSSQNGATIAVTKLNIAPNSNPAGVDTVYDNQYWLVNRYGTGSFETSLTFTVSENLSNVNGSVHSRIQLYTRPRNTDEGWLFHAEASVVDVVNEKATFSGITSFSQFIVCKKTMHPTYELIADEVDFDLVTNVFASIDVGSESAPAVTDIEGNNKLDILVGRSDGTMMHYEQSFVGSYSMTVVNSDLGLIDVGSNSAPCFANLNDNGYLDLLIGESENDVNYYEQSGIGTTVFDLKSEQFSFLAQSTYSKVAFTDLDNDGLQDLVVGMSNGQLERWEQDAVNSTSFSQNMGGSFYSIDVGDMAAPVFTDFEDDGLLDMLIGNQEGNIWYYRQNSSGSLTLDLISNNFLTIDVGDNSIPTFTDIDDDNLLDLIIGKSDGTLSHYEQNNTESIAFGTVLVGAAASVRSYHIRATDITGNMTVTAPAHFLVSLSSTSGFSQSVIISPNDGNIEEEIFVRPEDDAVGTFTGNISHAVTGLATKYIALSATGFETDDFAGNALDFDGMNDYVNIPDHSSLDLTTTYTIEAWIKPTAFTYLGGIVSKYQSSGSNGYFLRFNVTFPFNKLDFDGLITVETLPDLLTWYHVAAVNDNGTRKLYVNGVEKTLTGFAQTVESNSDPVRMGVDFNSRYYNGQIDEVRIWSVARTQSQIRENMCRNLPGDKPGLVSYWQLNQGSGSTAADYAGGMNGSLTNMDNSDWVISTAPVLYESIADGVWADASKWLAGQGYPSQEWYRAKINSNIVLSMYHEITDLTIESGKSLTIGVGYVLEVTGQLVNNAGISGLVIKSNSEGTGGLVSQSENVYGTAECYVSHYTDNNVGWNYISSPVANQAIRPEFVNSGTPNPANDFYKFSEPDYQWINTKEDISGNWNTGFEDAFVVGRGYCAAYAQDVTKYFTGEFNVGDFTFNTTSTPAITYTTGGGIGWNLVGNPFPSYIDWDDCGRTNVDGSVYAYDSEQGQYISWNGSVGSLSDGIISPLAGFFIKASESPSLTIPQSTRRKSAPVSGQEKSSVKDLLVLKAIGNGFSDKTYIWFTNDATTGFDKNADAYKLSGIDASPQLYTKTGDTRLSINALPYTPEEITIPLSLKVGQDGEYTISVVENSFWETVDISLKDLETQITYDLMTNPQLTFNLSTSNPDRFLLLINGATGLEENHPEDEGIEIYSYGNQVFIKTDEPGEMQVGVYNVLGQKVHAQTLTGFEILSGLTTGFYLVTAKTDNAFKAKKVFIQ